MRRYETIVITPEATPEETVRDVVSRLQAIVVRNGKVVRTDYWGRRTMAYEIAKSRRANYVMLDYVADPTIVAEAERMLQFNENVIRFHTVKIADQVNADEVKEEETRSGPPDIFSERTSEHSYESGEGSDENE